MTMLGPCVGPSAIQRRALTSLNKIIGLIPQSSLYNMGQCKQGSHSSTPSPLGATLFFFLQTSLFFIAVWVPVMAGPGSLHFHFHSCQEMNCNSTGPRRNPYPSKQVNSCPTESVSFTNQGENWPMG